MLHLWFIREQDTQFILAFKIRYEIPKAAAWGCVSRQTQGEAPWELQSPLGPSLNFLMVLFFQNHCSFLAGLLKQMGKWHRTASQRPWGHTQLRDYVWTSLGFSVVKSELCTRLAVSLMWAWIKATWHFELAEPQLSPPSLRYHDRREFSPSPSRQLTPVHRDLFLLWIHGSLSTMDNAALTFTGPRARMQGPHTLCLNT